MVRDSKLVVDQETEVDANTRGLVDSRLKSSVEVTHVVRWRMNIRKALPNKNEPTSTTVQSDDETKDEEKEEEDEDEKILNEMEELTDAMERKKKREKKLL